MKQAWQHSRFVAACTALLGTIRAAVARSQTRDTLARWRSRSVLYRWLTTRSNPVTVDLRKTYTVGLLLRVFDHLSASLAATSVVATVHGWEQAARTVLQHRPIAAASLVVLVALVTNTLVTFALGDLTSVGVGLRLVAIAPFLLGTRSRATGPNIRESVLGRLLDPRTRREDRNE